MGLMSAKMDQAASENFRTTRQSKILQAQSFDEDVRAAAVSLLLRIYWKSGVRFLGKRFGWGADHIEAARDTFNAFVEAKLRCSAAVLESDVRDLPALAARLREPRDRSGLFLRERISDEVRRKLAGQSGGAGQLEELRPALISEINGALRGSAWWREEPFCSAEWSVKIRGVLAEVRQTPPRNPLRVNRMLLDVAFRHEFVPFQDFFSNFDKAEGRFRSYFATSLSNWSATLVREQQAKKRGGGTVAIPLAEEVGEDEDLKHLLTAQLANPLSPEQVFKRQFAEDLVAEATRRLEVEYGTGEKGALFWALEEESAPDYKALAERFGKKEPALRKFWERINRRRRELIRELIRETLANPSDEALKEEQQELFEALGGDSRPDVEDSDLEPAKPADVKAEAQPASPPPPAGKSDQGSAGAP